MIASDRQQIDSLQNQIKRLQDEIAELKHNGTGSPAAPSADVSDRISRLESEVAAIQSTLPTVPAAPPVGTSETTPMTGVPTTPGSIAASVPGAPSAASPSAAEPPPTWPQDLDKEMASNSKEPGAKIYREGLTAMKSGNYSTAIIKFAKIQHTYPKSALSEPSQYFTANAFYESGKYEQSILQFNDLVMRFPDGHYTCQALLREGEAFMKLNDRIDARLTLQKVKGNNSCTNESTVADNMLKSLATD